MDWHTHPAVLEGALFAAFTASITLHMLVSGAGDCVYADGEVLTTSECKAWTLPTSWALVPCDEMGQPVGAHDDGYRRLQCQEGTDKTRGNWRCVDCPSWWRGSPALCVYTLTNLQ